MAVDGRLCCAGTMSRGISFFRIGILLVGALAGTILTACSASQPAPASSTLVVDLHAPVRAYVDAVNDEQLDALVAAFNPDGAVVDVGRRIQGHDAIRQWADDEVIGGTLEVLEVAESRPDFQKLLVRFAPMGVFGFRAYYAFTLADDHIALADLTYA